MHTAEAAAAAPTAAPAAPGTFWQLFAKCSDPSGSDPSSLFRRTLMTKFSEAEQIKI